MKLDSATHAHHQLPWRVHSIRDHINDSIVSMSISVFEYYWLLQNREEYKEKTLLVLDRELYKLKLWLEHDELRSNI